MIYAFCRLVLAARHFIVPLIPLDSNNSLNEPLHFHWNPLTVKYMRKTFIDDTYKQNEVSFVMTCIQVGNIFCNWLCTDATNVVPASNSQRLKVYMYIACTQNVEVIKTTVSLKNKFTVCHPKTRCSQVKLL